MFSRCVFASLVAGAVVALPATVSAQAWPPPPPPAKNLDRLPAARAQAPQPEVEELTPAQIKRAQEKEQEKETAPEATPLPRPAASKKSAASQSTKSSATSHAIACNGAFAKASSQTRLESAYKAENVAFTQVDGPDGTKVRATVLFPDDPKQRLEVWWANEETRAGTYLIVINGKSAWTAPHGVRLGLTLAALEKINHKPFKLKGLDKDEGSEVSDWNGGALAQLPGGCKVGVRMRSHSKVTAKLREAAGGNKEFSSNDAPIRAVKPVVAEIILGY